jgi:O-antigen/teichoic acid export membrane protein
VTALRRLLSGKFARDTIALQISRLGAVALSVGASVIVWRLLGPERYGIYGLALSLLTLLHALDVTGLNASTPSRLAVAIGARDHDEVRDLIAYHLTWTCVIHVTLMGVIWIFGTTLALWLHGDDHVGELALALTVPLLLDALYALILTALSARRSMITVAVLSLINQAVLSCALIAGALIDPRAESLVAARWGYSIITLIMAIGVYAAVRGRGESPLPTFSAIARRVGRVPGRRYWGFGLANAIDKNLADLFVQVPVQVVGAVGGSAAAGYLNLALTGIANAGLLTSALFDNLRAVIPQAVGRGDYVWLGRAVRRAMIGLAIGAVGVYGGLAVVAPFVVPPLLGEAWTPALPALAALCLYGAVGTVAGVLGPVYRALERMGAAIRAKLVALGVMLVGAGALALWNPPMPEEAAVGGALLISVVLLTQAVLTGMSILPEVHRRATAAPDQL